MQAVKTQEEEQIIVRGARVHNLKNVSLALPLHKLTVITGVSGSGKSSLAFDTIYAEGQRRYVESLSAYARQFLERMDKPDADEIIGIAPAIAIRQKNSTRNPRSTVATQTEIYDYLRLLYARVGRTFCHLCGREVIKDSPESAAGDIDRTKDNIAQSALNRRYGHRDLRLHAAAVGAGRRAIFTGHRPSDQRPDGQPDGRPDDGSARRLAPLSARPGGPRPQG